MPEPILAAKSTWFAPNVSSIKRPNITEIDIKDSYTPDSSVTVTANWDASAAKDGSVTCYVIGTKLIIAGNGSGKVYLNNENGSSCFCDFSSPFSSLKQINGMQFLDTSKTNRLDYMFCLCSSLEEVDVSHFNTTNVSNFTSMFTSCSSLKKIDLSKWDMSNATSTSSMLSSCDALAEIDISSFINGDKMDMNYMFAVNSAVQRTIKFPDTGLKLASDCTCMFLNNNMSTIDVSNFDTSKVTIMKAMFQECISMQNLDFSNWDTSSCTDMSAMFYGCTSLGEIDVSNWDTSKVTTLDHFAAHANLKRKGIGNWNTSSLVNANAAFHNCAEEELDLSGWDVSKVQFFCQMFENSPNLKRIKGLNKWNTSAGLGFDGMFERCSKLEEVDLSSFNTTKAKNGVSASTNGHKTATLNNMFLSCNNLEKVTVGANFSVNGDGTNTTAANKAILPTPSATYIPGADGNWYTFNGDQYAPNAMKDRTAATYYASRTAVYDADVIVKNGSLIDTAKAIREKNGTTAQYTPSEFGAAIRAL